MQTFQKSNFAAIKHTVSLSTKMEDLCNSSTRFFSDQHLCFADIIPPSEVTTSSPSTNSLSLSLSLSFGSELKYFGSGPSENRSCGAQFPQDLDLSGSCNLRSSAGISFCFHANYCVQISPSLISFCSLITISICLAAEKT